MNVQTKEIKAPVDPAATPAGPKTRLAPCLLASKPTKPVESDSRLLCALADGSL
jgi:hypothetical protein